MAFREKLRQSLGGQEMPPDDWTTTMNVIGEIGKRIISMSSGRSDKKTLW